MLELSDLRSGEVPGENFCFDEYGERSLAPTEGGDLRAARAELLICAAISGPADVREEEVNASMPTVVVEVRDDLDTDRC